MKKRKKKFVLLAANLTIEAKKKSRWESDHNFISGSFWHFPKKPTREPDNGS